MPVQCISVFARRSWVNVVLNVKVIATALHCLTWTVLFRLLLLLLRSLLQNR